MKRRAFAQLLALGGASALTGIDFDRYAAVLAGIRADDRALDDFERITLDLIRQEAAVSPSALMPAVRGHFTGLRDVLVWTPSALAPRAYSLAGQTALLAGYLWFKQDNYAEADGYWSLADRFGEQAGDSRLRAVLLVLQAYRWKENRDQSRTLLLLDRAASILGATPDPAVGALVLGERAARRADAAQLDPTYAVLALRDIDNARSHLARLDQPDSSLYIWESLTGEAIERQAETLLHLDRPNDAATELERVIASMDASWLSSRAYTTAHLAAAYAKAGDPEYASALLTDALHLATQASAHRNIERVRWYRQRWIGGYDGPALHRLDDQLRALPAQPSASPPPAISA